jgi:succinoglycan biosynthesis transport protein ExoP
LFVTLSTTDGTTVPVPEDSQTSPQRGALVAALRRSAALLLLLALLGAALGAAAGLRRAEAHTAEASILVSPLEGNPFSPTGRGDDLVNLETEAQLVSSDPVARLAARLDDEQITVASLLWGLDVSVPVNTQILTIRYTASSDTNAVRRAQAFANAYLEFRKSRSEQIVQSRTQRIQNQIDDQNKALSALVVRSNAETNPSNRSLLREQITGVTTQIGQLQAQLATLQTGAVDPGQVITPAGVVGQSSALAIGLYAAIGLLVGLTLGLGVVIMRARAENRIHEAIDVVPSGLPLLGSISMDEIQATNDSIVTADGDDINIGEGLQTLRVSVLSRDRRRPLRILYASAAEGSTSPRAALGLAYATASSSLATVLVDATTGAGDITEVLGLESRPGFTDVLAGDMSLQKALTSVSDHLVVLPAGRPDGRRVDDLMTGPLVGALFDQLGQIADVLIIATGPLRSPRSQALAMVTDVTLVEAEESQSRLADLVAIAEDPTLSHSLLGVVFVGRARSRPRTPART